MFKRYKPCLPPLEFPVTYISNVSYVQNVAYTFDWGEGSLVAYVGRNEGL